jgi:type VI protein secretion system component Hcp
MIGKLAFAAGCLVLAAGVGFATGAIPSGDGVIHGCYVISPTGAAGQLRVIDAEAGAKCNRNEKALDWSQRGPKGDTGPPGPPGPPGPSGSPPPEHTQIVGELLIPSLGVTSAIHGFEVSVTIDVDSCGAGCGTGRAVLSDIQIAKPVNGASVPLTRAAITGSHWPAASVSLTNPSGGTYASFQLTDGTVTEVTPDTDDAAGEGVSLHFASLAVSQGAASPPAPPRVVGTLTSSDLEDPSSLTSLDWDVHLPASDCGAGCGTGRPDVADLAIDTPLDGNAISLFRSAATGRHIQQVDATVTQSPDDEGYELDDVVIPSVRFLVTGAAGDAPHAKVAFDYGQITRAVGTASVCWDKALVATC